MDKMRLNHKSFVLAALIAVATYLVYSYFAPFKWDLHHDGIVASPLVFGSKSFRNYGPAVIIFQKPFLDIFGFSILSLRLGAAFFSALNASLVYLIAARYMSKRFALLCSIAYASSHYAVAGNLSPYYIHPWPSSYALTLILLSYLVKTSRISSKASDVIAGAITGILSLIKPNYGLVSLLLYAWLNEEGSSRIKKRDYSHHKGYAVYLVSLFTACVVVMKITSTPWATYLEHLEFVTTWARNKTVVGHSSINGGLIMQVIAAGIAGIRVIYDDFLLIGAAQIHGGVGVTQVLLRLVVYSWGLMEAINFTYYKFYKFRGIQAKRLVKLPKSLSRQYINVLKAALACTLLTYPVPSLMHIYYSNCFEYIAAWIIISSLYNTLKSHSSVVSDFLENQHQLRRILLYKNSTNLLRALSNVHKEIISGIIIITFLLPTLRHYFVTRRTTYNVDDIPASGRTLEIFRGLKTTSLEEYVSLKQLSFLLTNIFKLNVHGTQCFFINDTRYPGIAVLAKSGCVVYNEKMPFNWDTKTSADAYSIGRLKSVIKKEGVAILATNSISRLYDLGYDYKVIGTLAGDHGKDFADNVSIVKFVNRPRSRILNVKRQVNMGNLVSLLVVEHPGEGQQYYSFIRMICRPRLNIGSTDLFYGSSRNQLRDLIEKRPIGVSSWGLYSIDNNKYRLLGKFVSDPEIEVYLNYGIITALSGQGFEGTNTSPTCIGKEYSELLTNNSSSLGESSELY